MLEPGLGLPVSERSLKRSHFRRNILIDAVLSVAIVLSGFLIFDHLNSGSRLDSLMRSGGIAISSSQLVEHVRAENIQAYWLGPISGYKYTIICKNRSQIIVSYIPDGQDPRDPNHVNLVVETYANTLMSERPGFSNTNNDPDDYQSVTESVDRLDRNYPRRVTFTVTGTGNVVEIQYPTFLRFQGNVLSRSNLKLVSESKP